MAAGFETIGWVLSVRDDATNKVEKITKGMEQKFVRAAHFIEGVTEGITAWGDARGKLAKSVLFVGRSFVSVIGGGAGEAAQAVTEGFLKATTVVTDFATAPFIAVEKAVRGVAKTVKEGWTTPFVKAKDAVKGIGASIGKRFKAEWKGEVDQFMLSDAFDAAKKMVDVSGGAVKSFFGKGIELVQDMFKTPAEDAATLAENVKKSRFETRGAGVETKDLAKSFFNVGDTFKMLDKFGGVAGVILGPLAPLMKLFEPLIDMVVSQFTPAIETFKDIVESAFGPFAMTLEIIARNLATKLLPLIAPFASMLELIAVQLGTHIAKAMEGINGSAGGLSKLFEGLMGAVGPMLDAFSKLAMKLLPVVIGLFDQLVPIAVELVTMLVENLVPIVEMWGEIAAELGPELVKVIVQLLKAVMPLIPPLLKLYTTLYTELFGPLLMTALKGVVMLLQNVIIPIISKLVELFVPALKSMAEWISIFADAFAIAFEEVQKWLEDFIYAVFVGNSPSLMDVFTIIPKAIEGFVTVFERLGEMFENIASIVIDGFVHPVIEGFKTISTRVLDWTETMFNLLWNARDDIIDFVLNIDKVFLKFLNKTLPRIWTGFWGWVTKTFTAAKQWFLDMVDRIMEALGLTGAGEKVRGIFNAVLTAMRAPVQALVRWINYMVIGSINEILKAEIPVIGGSLGTITQGLFGYSSLPELQLAEGGVVQQRPGGTLARIGEGGDDEVVLPLRADTIERVLVPLLPAMKFPALDRLVEIAASIDKRMAGTLRVDSGMPAMSQHGASGGGGEGEINSAGMQGVVTW